MAKINETAAAKLINSINNNFYQIMLNDEGHIAPWSRYLYACIDDTTKDLLSNLITEMYNYIASYNGEPEELYIEEEYCGRWVIKKFDCSSFSDYYTANQENLTYTLEMLKAYIKLELEDAISMCMENYNDVMIDVDDLVDDKVIEISIEGK